MCQMKQVDHLQEQELLLFRLTSGIVNYDQREREREKFTASSMKVRSKMGRAEETGSFFTLSVSLSCPSKVFSSHLDF